MVPAYQRVATQEESEEMTEKLQRMLWIGTCLLALGIWLMPVHSFGALKKDTAYFAEVEKILLSSSTKTVEYQYGKINSGKNKYWKKAVSLPLTASKVKISKKGWYTVRVTSDSGNKKLSKKLHKIKLKKKTYRVAANTPVKQKAGRYYLIPKGNKGDALKMPAGSCQPGIAAIIGEKEAAAYSVWQLKPAEGKKFRLKNSNSNLYLGLEAGKTKSGASFVQKKYSETDMTLLFEAASAGGSYYYIKNVGNGRYLRLKDNVVVAAKRKNKKAWKYRIKKTKKPDSYAAARDYTYPTSVLLGSSFVLKGTVSSHYTMTSLTASVINNNNTVVLKKTVAPESCLYDLKGIDAAMTFGRLPVGNYRYIVTVTDKRGATFTVINRNFGVYALSIVNGKVLSYDAAKILAIGHQSNGTALEKKACASYALAYCNSILDGTTPSPHTYWLSETKVDCVWSKGGYTTYAYDSESAVLQAAYAQITAGRPCILYVTGSTSSQHWLTLIGYKNVTSVQSLNAGNFIAIDPWDGAVITVSDKYKVKNPYRLGYKS
ncbi:MAG: RICIN domain-containing protein [Lachnospiraceae bacterium]|nr:RICIN domain-containing protein [Lachnospiraceae bacterium]